MPIVSIVIPAFNAEPYIEKCLSSMKKQTFADTEIIVVDDGSTDNTYTLASKLAKTDKRISVVKQNNSGAGVARNKGLSLAKGDYLLFFDADDFAEESMLQDMTQRAVETEADIVICRSRYLDNKTEQTYPIYGALRNIDANFVDSGETLRDRLFQFCIGWPWDKLFKKSFVQENGLLFQDTRTTNDAFFVFVALAKAEKIAYVDKELVLHRVNNESSLERTRDASWNNSFLAIEAIESKLKEEGLFETFRQSLDNWIANYLTWHFMTVSPETQEAMLKTTSSFLSARLSLEKKDYFYQERDWNSAHILTSSQAELVVRGIKSLDTEDRLQESIEHISHMQEANDYLKAELEKTQAQLTESRSLYDGMLSSITWKAGKALMFIPHTIKAALKRS